MLKCKKKAQTDCQNRTIEKKKKTKPRIWLQNLFLSSLFLKFTINISKNLKLILYFNLLFVFFFTTFNLFNHFLSLPSMCDQTEKKFFFFQLSVIDHQGNRATIIPLSSACIGKISSLIFFFLHNFYALLFSL